MRRRLRSILAPIFFCALALSPLLAQEERQTLGASGEERLLAAMHSISSRLVFDYVFGTSGARPEILNPEIMRDLARLVFLATVDLANGSRKIEDTAEEPGTPR